MGQPGTGVPQPASDTPVQPPQPQPTGDTPAYQPQPQPQPIGDTPVYAPQPQPIGDAPAYQPQPQPTADGPWQVFPAQPPFPPPTYIDQPPAYHASEPPRLAARQPRFTWSPLGLVVGLLGVVVQALFTYLVTFEPTSQGQWQPALDAGRTAVLLGHLDKLSTFRVWEVPLVLIVPFLPFLQMLVVIVLSIPRARTVSPQLVSRGRIGWVLFFGLLTVYAVISTLAFGPAGAPQLLFYWVGGLVVAVGIALPHRPD